jgi:hypothetical protein
MMATQLLAQPCKRRREKDAFDGSRVLLKNDAGEQKQAQPIAVSGSRNAGLLLANRWKWALEWDLFFLAPENLPVGDAVCVCLKQIRLTETQNSLSIFYNRCT